MKLFVLLAMTLCLTIVLNAIPMWDNPVPIRQGDQIRWNRCGSVTADGCMIYVWTGTKRGDRDIYAQKVSASGAILWQTPILVDSKPSRQANPVISRTTDNNFVIAWWEYNASDDTTIRAQKITSNGQLLWSAGGIPICSIPQHLSGFESLADNNNGVYVVWGDVRNSTTNGTDIYGQHIDGYGNSMWITDGIPLANSANDDHSFAIGVDVSGMLNIAYQETHLGASQIKVNRFLSSGQPAWTQPILISGLLIDNYYVQMAALQDSSFVVTWAAAVSNYDPAPNIYAHKYDLNGNLVWANPMEVYSDANAPYPVVQRNPRIVNSGDNTVIIAWEDFRNNYDDPDIFAQKMNSNGQILWNTDGVSVSVADYAQSEPRLVSDNEGGCFITWEDTRNGNYPNFDIYAQHLSSMGISLWETQGKPICTLDLPQSAPMLRVVNDNIFIGWMDERDGSSSVYYQVINSVGNPVLETNGLPVHQGLGGNANYWDYTSLARSSDVAIIWQDTRTGRLGYKIYYQFLNPDGTVDLEPNGIPITLSMNPIADQRNFSAVVTPDDKIAVVWEERNFVKAQLIDVNGNRLWGDNGIMLTDSVSYRQKDAKIVYENGAFFIGWAQLDSIYTVFGLRLLYRVYGQKIVNSEKQWGSNGILISVHYGDDVNFDVNLSQMTGRYFVWEKTSIDPDTFGYQNIFVKLVNPDGTTASGWPDSGISTSDYWDYDVVQILSKCTITNNGLVVIWFDFRTNFIKKVYGQLISPQGVRLWDADGIPLTENDIEANDVSLIGLNDSFTLFWSASLANGIKTIKTQKFNLYGTPLWNTGGNLVSSSAPYYSASSANPIQFSNGGMLVAWEQYISSNPSAFNYPDVYYRYINPDGSILGNLVGTSISTAFDMQTRPKLAVVGNEAILTWGDSDFYFSNDERCGPEPDDSFNLYAQKLSNEVVAIDDETIPILGMTLEQNYPNPFNPTTNISFTLKAKSTVALTIYNQKGQKVKTLHSGLLDKGNHRIEWDGKDDNDKPVSSGVYMYRLSNKNNQLTRKMVLLK